MLSFFLFLGRLTQRGYTGPHGAQGTVAGPPGGGAADPCPGKVAHCSGRGAGTQSQLGVWSGAKAADPCPGQVAHCPGRGADNQGPLGACPWIGLCPGRKPGESSRSTARALPALPSVWRSNCPGGLQPRVPWVHVHGLDCVQAESLAKVADRARTTSFAQHVALDTTEFVTPKYMHLDDEMIKLCSSIQVLH